MNENQTWYYTDANGQQTGPVSSTEIQQLAANGKVTGRTMVWSEGMDNWTFASQLDGILPAADPQPTTAPATAAANTAIPTAAIEPAANPTANPYATPLSAPAESTYMDIESYDGIGRLNYFLKSLLYTLLGIGLIAIGATIQSWILMIIAGIALLIVLIRISDQRIQNIGASGWWLLLMIVPLAGSLLQIALLACPTGYAHHKKLDTAGIVVGTILIALNLLSFVLNFVTGLGLPA